MDKFKIKGGNRLCGDVNISGAKNAALAVIPATLLARGVCTIENVPNIRDVSIMIQIIEGLGAKVRRIDSSTIQIDTEHINSHSVPDSLAKKMRASYYFIGALLGRSGIARVALPGGCDFGLRPIDQHIKSFEAFGARVSENNALVSVSAEKLNGSSIYFDVVSVGATMNAMLAAVKANGLTIIENVAKEPHIVDLANFLNLMGADVRGAGTDVIKIRGVQNMHGCTYSIIPDQIEAGTYMVAAAATGGDVTVRNVIPKHLESISAKLEESGATVEEFDDSVRVYANGRLVSCKIQTMPHPGFPTDMQPQFAALLSTAEGTSVISESIWDNRFRYVAQLLRMGASIHVQGKSAVIEGVRHLTGAPVRADDLRAGAAMVIAGLSAKGETEIEQIHLIERGYEDILGKLRSLGADIERITDEESDHDHSPMKPDSPIVHRQVG